MARRVRNTVLQSERFAQCHSFGHEWHHARAIGIDETPEGWTRPWGGAYGMIGFPSTCRNCGGERMRWVSRSGETHNRYQMPDGYGRRASRGDEVLTPTEHRRAYVATLFDAFEQTMQSNKASA